MVAGCNPGSAGDTALPPACRGCQDKTNGSVAARVQIVALSMDPKEASVREFATAQLDLSEFRVLGHVAGRGDVIVDGDNWVGGPLAPSRIEGIAIRWPTKPSDLVLRYGVTVGGPRPIMGQIVETGNFAGTKGRALPLVGATIEIDGPAAGGHQLMVDLIFLGSPQTKVLGRRVVLSGPTGREPLVGLRLRLEPSERPKLVRQAGQTSPLCRNASVTHQEISHRPARQSAAATVAEPDDEPYSRNSVVVPPQGRRPGRVRVFRSGARSKQSQAAQ